MYNVYTAAPRSLYLIYIAMLIISGYLTNHYENHISSDIIFKYLFQASCVACILMIAFDVSNPAKNAAIKEMLINSEGRYPCREETASLLSRWSFSWVDDLLKLGYSKSLEAEDLPQLAQDDKVVIRLH